MIDSKSEIGNVYFHISKDVKRDSFELYEVYIGAYSDSIYMVSENINDIVALRDLLNEFIEKDGDKNEN